MFALEKNHKHALFFLEIDRGTETISNPTKGLGKHIRFSEGYAQEEKYKGYAEDFHCEPFSNFRLLIVTTSAKRVESIRKALGQNPKPLYRFFWLTTFDQVGEDTIFERIYGFPSMSVMRGDINWDEEVILSSFLCLYVYRPPPSYIERGIYMAASVILKKNIISEWGQLITGAPGKSDEYHTSVIANLKADAVPGISWAYEDFGAKKKLFVQQSKLHIASMRSDHHLTENLR